MLYKSPQMQDNGKKELLGKKMHMQIKSTSRQKTNRNAVVIENGDNRPRVVTTLLASMHKGLDAQPSIERSQL